MSVHRRAGEGRYVGWTSRLAPQLSAIICLLLSSSSTVLAANRGQHKTEAKNEKAEEVAEATTANARGQLQHALKKEPPTENPGPGGQQKAEVDSPKNKVDVAHAAGSSRDRRRE
ncbi:unnamed protein product, partial [Amoebophrya sp. A25]|eukprot:GSA25T00009257001.1